MKNSLCELEINGVIRKISCETLWTSSRYYLYVDEELIEAIPRKKYQDMRGGLCYNFKIDGHEVMLVVQSEQMSIVYEGVEHMSKGRIRDFREKVEIPVWLARSYIIFGLGIIAADIFPIPSWVIFVMSTCVWYIFLYYVSTKFKYTNLVCMGYMITVICIYLAKILGAF